MSTAERDRQTTIPLPATAPPPPNGDATARLPAAPVSLAAALAPVRRRVLTRVFLRWYCVCALALDIAALLALLFLRPSLTTAVNFALAATLLIAPMIVAGTRCLAVRLPLPRLAQLVDERAGLQERVASAVEACTRPAQFKSPRMLMLLAEDAIDALSAIDPPRLLPLKRETVLAAIALAATLVLLLWHAPTVVDIAVGGGSQSQPNAIEKLFGERQTVLVKPTAGNPSRLATPAQKKQPNEPPAPARAKPQGSGNPSAQAHVSSQQHGGAGRQQDKDSGARGQNSDRSQSPKAGMQSSSSGGTPALAPRPASAKGGSSLQPQTIGKSRSGASGGKPKPQTASGQQAERQNSGTHNGQPPKNQTAGGKADQPNGAGKPNSAQPQSRKPQPGGSGGQAFQGQKPEQGQVKANGRISQAASKPAGQRNGSTSRSPSPSKGTSSASDNRSVSVGAPHPGNPFTTGGHGKPLSIKPRDLPAIANRSHFSYRLPKLSGGALKDVPAAFSKQAGNHHANSLPYGSKVPYGTGQVSAPASGDSPQVSDVEQNPRIPAGYRNLVRQYFGNGSERSR